jgi:hypothetical protein
MLIELNQATSTIQYLHLYAFPTESVEGRAERAELAGLGQAVTRKKK